MDHMSHEELAIIMDEIDENNDGTLDFQEFRMWYSKASEVAGAGNVGKLSFSEIFAGNDPNVRRHRAAQSVYYGQLEFAQPVGWQPDATRYYAGTLAYVLTSGGFFFMRTTRALSDADCLKQAWEVKGAFIAEQGGHVVEVSPSQVCFVGGNASCADVPPSLVAMPVTDLDPVNQEERGEEAAREPPAQAKAPGGYRRTVY